jgi:hypothetical protein
VRKPRHLAATPGRRRIPRSWPLLLAVATFALGWLLCVATDRDARPAGYVFQPAGTPTTTIGTVPQACVVALRAADRLAGPAARLGPVAVHHAKLMHALDRFLDGEPGGLSGQQVYTLGKPHVAVMESDGPKARDLARQYRKVRPACPST